jgi:hypothetical protein
MKKIISLFQRNYDTDRLVRNEVTPGAEWVLNGEGIPTEKIDGTCCMIRGGKMYKRYDVKKGKTAPPNFEAAQDPDPITGHWPGWLPVGNGPEDQYHSEAFNRELSFHALEDGTYELVGPKIQGNPYELTRHGLEKHGAIEIGQCPDDLPLSFDGIRVFLQNTPIEGIVWHHPDGRMVKIKARDFGLPWPRKE